MMRDGRSRMRRRTRSLPTPWISSPRLFGPVNRYEGIRGGRVATPLGPLETPGFAESSQVDIAVRADGIGLEDASSAPADRVRARVRSVRRLGTWTLALMTPVDRTREARRAGESVEPASIQARLPGTAAFAPGDLLALRAKPGHTFVFPAPQGRG